MGFTINVKNRAAFIKSVSRGAFIVVGAVETATNTYLKAGHTFGFNATTILGIAGTAAFPVLATLQRYFDKNDPAFGAISNEAAALATAKLKAAGAVIPA
jgi:hypothetical protein